MLAPPFQYSYLYLMLDAVIEQALRDAQNILWRNLPPTRLGGPSWPNSKRRIERATGRAGGSWS